MNEEKIFRKSAGGLISRMGRWHAEQDFVPSVTTGILSYAEQVVHSKLSQLASQNSLLFWCKELQNSIGLDTFIPVLAHPTSYSSGTLHSALKVSEFHSSSVIIMSSFSTVCTHVLGSADFSTPEGLRGEHFYKAHRGNWVQHKGQGKLYPTLRGGRCPSSQHSDHTQDESVWHDFHYLLCLSDSTHNI